MLKNLYLLIVSLFVCNIINSQVVIKGHISEFDGGALIGATVVEKGTNNGTLADVDGNLQKKWLVLAQLPMLMVILPLPSIQLPLHWYLAMWDLPLRKLK